VLQRVERAQVRIDGEPIGTIGVGLVALVGVRYDDTAEHAVKLARKIHELRVLRGERSIADTPEAAVLVVSQFTLYADVRKGRRPSWNAAAPAATAEPLVDLVVSTLKARGAEVATGQFGARMQIELLNDGPVTILVEV
jgi:D-aminoacyl-tRNA deacylase